MNRPANLVELPPLCQSDLVNHRCHFNAAALSKASSAHCGRWRIGSGCLLPAGWEINTHLRAPVVSCQKLHEEKPQQKTLTPVRLRI
jgi:hypothetical protein